MASIVSLGPGYAAKLNERRTVTIELPEFVIRALEYRVHETNEGSDSDEVIDLNDVIEWYLVSPLSVKEMPELEAVIPGFTGALTKWLFDATYEPPD